MQAQNNARTKPMVKVVIAILYGMAATLAGTLLAINYHAISIEPVQAAMLVTGMLVAILAMLSALFIRVYQDRRRAVQ